MSEFSEKRKSKDKEKSSVYYATISNSIVLVLIGFFLLSFFHINTITDIVKEKINILVELEDKSGETNKSKIMAFLEADERIVEQSVEFVPETTAAELMGSDFTQSFEQVGKPFKNIVKFNVKSIHYTDENLASLAAALRGMAGVGDVFYENVIIDQVKSNLKKLSFGILLVALVFVFLATVIMYNTINLSLYADRWEIKTMEIIGARDRFIRQPYLKMAGRIAIRSFFFSTLFIIFILGLFWANFPVVMEILSIWYVGVSFAIMFVLALIITSTATIKIVNSYLYKSAHELHS